MTITAKLFLAVLLFTAAGCAATPPAGERSAAVATDSMEAVVKRSFTAYGFALESGQSLPEMTLAFETYGRPAPER